MKKLLHFNLFWFLLLPIFVIVNANRKSSNEKVVDSENQKIVKQLHNLESAGRAPNRLLERSSVALLAFGFNS